MRTKSCLFRTASAVMLGAAALSGAAFAQEQTHTQSSQDVIVITGIRGSLSQALDLKRDATGVRESIVAEDIGQFPDTNIAESLQRLPGVAITRANGEGQQITLRGLGPEFTRVTLNGMTIANASTGQDDFTTSGREFDFDIFASEHFNRVDVVKTPSASIIEGGIAGNVNLQTARPFDYDGFTMQGSVSGFYQDLPDKVQPRLAGMVSWTNEAKTFGLLVSAAFQQRSARIDGTSSVGYEHLAGDTIEPDLANSNITQTREQLEGIYIPRLPRTDLTLADTDRLGITAAAQWAPTAQLSFNFDVLYANTKYDALRYNQDIQFRSTPGGGRPAITINEMILDDDGDTAVYLDVSNATLRSENRIIERETTMQQYVLSGAWESENWTLKGMIGVESAEFNVAEETTVQLVTDPVQATFDIRGNHDYPIVTPGVDLGIINNYNGGDIRLRPSNIQDDVFSTRFDVERFFGDDSIQFGVSFEEYQKDVKRFSQNVSTAAYDISQYARPHGVSDFASDAPDNFLRNWVVADFEAANKLLNYRDVTPAQSLGSSSVINEKTLGAYVQANVNTDAFGLPLRSDVGVRVVRTDLTTDGYVNGKTPARFESDYTDVLPSANFALDVHEDMVVRLAMSRSLTRPSLSALNPGTSVSINNRSVKSGNPDLEPFRSNNLDVAFEWYFQDDAAFGVTLFYKDLESLITSNTYSKFFDPGQYIPGQTGDQSGLYEFNSPVNGEGASITGLEVSYQQPFTFLPAPFDGLGVLANYTYTDSTATFGSGDTVVTTTLPGLSEHAFNLVGYYEKDAFSARLAYNWRDDFVMSPFGRNGLTRYREAAGFLDFSVRYDVLENVSAFVEGINVLDQEENTYAGSPDRFEKYVKTGAQYLFGVRASF
ncbi:TonB-dependent receptor [Woodsholea maritima]|uniref:TonB-dependent receptor n=1 Tax=Woodsholea maritima TaxID=240237 RepID=UPI001461423F|nr:TonB-dependent receptor [Woodsholea maritima]